MEVRKMKRKKQRKTIALWILLMMTAVCMTGCGKTVETMVESSEEETVEESVFAIVSNIDEVNGKITLRAVSYSTELVLSYNGGVDVQDKYGEILSMQQVELGSIVDAVYDVNKNKLLSMHMTGDANVQKLEGVSGVEIDEKNKSVKMNGTTYRLATNTSAFSDNREIELEEICSEDQLTVWLCNDTVCSMYVELGHGYVRLEDYASYIGGMIEIGYDVIVPVSKDMLLTVREGDYTLRISKGENVGTKQVRIVKNQEQVISLADIAIEPKSMGSVLFKVTPSDAQVYIDGKKINTEGAVELVYGKHKINIVAEGYESYSASFNVEYAYKIKEYTLVSTENGTTESSTTTTQNAANQVNNTTAANQTTEKGTEKTTEETTQKGTEGEEGKTTENKVTITSPTGASVYFDGEYIGITPITIAKVAGSHVLTFSKTGYLSKSYTVTFLDDGKDETLEYESLVSISSLVQ